MATVTDGRKEVLKELLLLLTGSGCIKVELGELLQVLKYLQQALLMLQRVVCH